MLPQTIRPNDKDRGPPSADRRSSPRRPCRWEASLRPPAAGGVPHWASVRDVSAGGAGLLMSCPPRPGEALLLEFAGPKEGPVPAVCRVVYCIEQLGGNAALGCAFDRLLSESELRRLVM